MKTWIEAVGSLSMGHTVCAARLNRPPRLSRTFGEKIRSAFRELRQTWNRQFLPPSFTPKAKIEPKAARSTPPNVRRSPRSARPEALRSSLRMPISMHARRVHAWKRVRLMRSDDAVERCEGGAAEDGRRLSHEYLWTRRHRYPLIHMFPPCGGCTALIVILRQG